MWDRVLVENTDAPCRISGGDRSTEFLPGAILLLCVWCPRKMTYPHWQLVVERKPWIKPERATGQEGEAGCPVPHKSSFSLPSLIPASEVTWLTTSEGEARFIFHYSLFSCSLSSGS